MSTEIAPIHRKRIHRDMPDRSRVVAVLEIREAGGNLSAGFSLTGEVYEAHGTWSGAAQERNGRDCDACGQVTDELSRAFPNLAAFAAMHLSDLDGVPMYAIENGWYFYSGQNDAYKARQGLPVTQSGQEIAAKLLRVDSIPDGLDREAFAAFVDEQRPRWADEAREAVRLFDSLEAMGA